MERVIPEERLYLVRSGFDYSHLQNIDTLFEEISSEEETKKLEEETKKLSEDLNQYVSHSIIAMCGVASTNVDQGESTEYHKEFTDKQAVRTI